MGSANLLDVGLIQPRAGHLYDWVFPMKLAPARAFRARCWTAKPQCMHGIVADSAVWRFEPSLLGEGSAPDCARAELLVGLDR